MKRGGPDESGFIRFAYRPFDNRWLYCEKDTELLSYREHAILDRPLKPGEVQHVSDTRPGGSP